MRRVISILMLLSIGFALGVSWKAWTAHAEPCGPMQNGDVNADKRIDLSDAVGLLSFLFLGGKAPTPLYVADYQCVTNIQAELAVAEANLVDSQGKLAVAESGLATCKSELNSCQSRPSIPATGQTQCYDDQGNAIDCASTDFPGQDGFYQAGCPTEDRFVDNGDGTLTDTCTGLMWQKDTAPGAYTWQEALKYCKGLDLAGHTDWRLPNARELQSLAYMNYTTGLGPLFGGRVINYWTSTSGGGGGTGGSLGAFDLNSDNGAITAAVKGTPMGVLAVRGGL